MKKLLLALCLSVLAFPAAAGNHCYDPEQVRAERLLRLHSELMVITVTCKQASNGRDLVTAYTGFTRKNVRDIREAEQTLIQYYKSSYGSDAVDRLDKLRTKLANEYGQQIADLSAPAFCGQRRDKVVLMFDSPPPSLYDEAARVYAADYSYEPACKGVTQTASLGSTKAEKEPKKTPPVAKKAEKKG